MAGRCGCAQDRCSCYIEEGANVSISGAGTRDNPYVVSAAVTGSTSTSSSGTVTSQWLPGMIVEWGGTTAPTGWLLCDGAEVNREVYADLFAVIGTTRGAGNGTTTFNVPDRRNRFAIGASATYTRGTKGGSSTITLTTSQLPSHTHSINHDHPRTGTGGSHDHELQRSGAVGSSNSTIPQGTGTTVSSGTGAIASSGGHDHSIPAYTGTSGSSGSGAAITILPPYEASNFIIKT